MSADPYFLAEGARLRYRDEGAGAVIVLVHGWALDLDMWNPQAESLQARFRTIRFDRRGFGLSCGIPNLRQDALDALALCRHLQVEPIGCVGMSQGARVVLHLARLQPQLLTCFVLDGPPDVHAAPGSRPGDLDYNALKALARTEGLSVFRREWARHPLATLETADPARHRLLEQMIARYPGTDLLSAPETPNDPPGEFEPAPLTAGASNSSLTQPALVLNGALDTPVRLHAGEALARALPHCEREIVPLARHLSNLDNPDAYNSLLLSFFCRHL